MRSLPDAESWVRAYAIGRANSERTGIVLLAYGAVKTGLDVSSIWPACSRLSVRLDLKSKAGALEYVSEGFRAVCINDTIVRHGVLTELIFHLLFG